MTSDLVSDPRLTPDHWRVGNHAVWLVSGLVPVLGAAPFQEITGTVAPTVPRFGNWVSRAALPGQPDGEPTGAWSVDVFHTDPHCLPCARALQDTRAELTESCDRYWAQWSPRAHRRFTELRSHIDWTSIDGDERGTFTADADVPDWLREATAGALIGRADAAVASSLLLAWANAPIPWPRLLAAHPGEVAVPSGDAAARRQATWPEIAEAFETIEAAGRTAYLDVALEVDQDGGLLMETNAVGIYGLDTTHGDVTDLDARVTDILSIESDWRGIWETG
ncbi:hypothetical protein O4160_15090 [Rhodococcus sp. IEGM 1401]|uniref:hypothetical protein n=1 Tax=unclassified Rhodococcus (in: high G+C Gram-positive bacteria) TaxID=192944 RepID=UPI0022B32812|nr:MULTISPECIES: hypothetical protein [unclassified Rhodococcus (in: high G+C Gram-positive bacteria)]MCZ4562165.1 hypothetical protein [Rhodococcus sp. IEGM 1401]MDI9922208.1 hypothetical protein [Rhodococcus sp. IEGM 1372]MDV8035309.1 hypothetical protein [Rhodococcus sp. IEGM 1414]